MYQKFFGIHKKPFSIAPDPTFLYMSDGHREALAHLRYGLENDGGFVLLTGEVGAGKTTVCRCLLEQIPEDTNVAFILNPKLSPIELLATICDELAIATPEFARIKELIDAINGYLLAAHSEGRHTVLIIDEAQNLSVEVLEQIRLLTNLETSEQKLLQIIMLGQPELQEKLAGNELKQLAQRISARFHLGPLSARETTAYVHHRLAIAGMAPQIFSQGSLKKLYYFSGGIPRLINIICDRALLGAYAKGLHTVSNAVMAVAGGEVFGGKLRRESLRYISPWLVAGVTILVCGIVVALLNWSSPVVKPAGTVKKMPAVSSPVSTMEKGAGNAAATSKMPVKWPAGVEAAKSDNLAMQTLLGIWGLEGFASDKEWGCQYAENNGLRCLVGQSGLAALLRLNRPAILKMRNKDGQNFSVVLVAESGGRLKLRHGDKVINVVSADLATHWSGSYVLFWRPPIAYSESIRPGHKGRDVDWLAEQLALVAGEEYNARSEPATFNDSMVRKIKKIQFDHDFIPDGIVGKETIILLNTLTGAKVPYLRKIGA